MEEFFDPELAKQIGENIRDLRRENELGQKEICVILDNMPQPTYSNYENGVSILPSRHLLTLAKYYGVTTDYILGRTHYTEFPENLNHRITKTQTAADILNDVIALNENGRRRLVDYLSLLKLKYQKRR